MCGPPSPLSFLHDKRHLRGPRRSPLGIHWCCPAHDTRKEGHACAVEGDGGQPLRSSHRIQKKRGGENRRGAGASSMPLDSPAPPPLINTVAPRACAALTVVCGSGGYMNKRVPVEVRFYQSNALLFVTGYTGLGDPNSHFYVDAQTALRGRVGRFRSTTHSLLRHTGSKWLSLAVWPLSVRLSQSATSTSLQCCFRV